MIRTMAVLCAALAACSSAAWAQDAREAQLIGFHQLCEHGDRVACVRFGSMLQQNRDRHDEWRRSHPEFFVFER